jgi:hypothetical protein
MNITPRPWTEVHQNGDPRPFYSHAMAAYKQQLIAAGGDQSKTPKMPPDLQAAIGYSAAQTARGGDYVSHLPDGKTEVAPLWGAWVFTEAHLAGFRDGVQYVLEQQAAAQAQAQAANEQPAAELPDAPAPEQGA